MSFQIIPGCDGYSDMGVTLERMTSVCMRLAQHHPLFFSITFWCWKKSEQPDWLLALSHFTTKSHHPHPTEGLHRSGVTHPQLGEHSYDFSQQTSSSSHGHFMPAACIAQGQETLGDMPDQSQNL